jgi:hypothetical protein
MSKYLVRTVKPLGFKTTVFLVFNILNTKVYEQFNIIMRGTLTLCCLSSKWLLSKAVPLHAMVALGGRGVAPTHY